MSQVMITSTSMTNTKYHNKTVVYELHPLSLLYITVFNTIFGLICFSTSFLSQELIKFYTNHWIAELK